MAATAIPTTRFVREGIDLTGAGAAAVVDGGDGLELLRNDGNMVIIVSSVGSPQSLTIHKGASVGDATFEPDEHMIEPGNEYGFGPFPPALYNDANGSVMMEAGGGLLVYGLRI